MFKDINFLNHILALCLVKSNRKIFHPFLCLGYIVNAILVLERKRQLIYIFLWV